MELQVAVIPFRVQTWAQLPTLRASASPWTAPPVPQLWDFSHSQPFVPDTVKWQLLAEDDATPLFSAAQQRSAVSIRPPSPEGVSANPEPTTKQHASVPHAPLCTVLLTAVSPGKRKVSGFHRLFGSTILKKINGNLYIEWAALHLDGKPLWSYVIPQWTFQRNTTSMK